MTISEATGGLFPEVERPAGIVNINERCILRTREGYRLVIVGGIVLAQYASGDRMAEAYAMVSLVEQGWADQNDVARAFGCSARTIRRYEARLAEGGLAALGRASGFPRGHTRVSPSDARQLNRLKAKGLSNRQIAEQLGISEKAVRKRLRRSGWNEVRPVEARLPFEDLQPPSFPAEPPASADPNLSAFLSPPQETRVLDLPAPADLNLSAFCDAEEAQHRQAGSGSASPEITSCVHPASPPF